jgi:mevalonate kinase
LRGVRGAELKLLFYGVSDNALSRLGQKPSFTGKFRLENGLPVGTGLGASAALCGAVSRWCEAQGWISESTVYEFARQLEDLFHGESSGVDLAVALSATGVRFVRGGERAAVHPKWWPRFYLSYCGQRGMTAECVNKVKALHGQNRELAEKLDRQMGEATRLAEKALGVTAEAGMPVLQQALGLARDCFENWGLVAGDLKRHLRQLEAAGAKGVKPTGSGGGGYVLSLWADEPPVELLDLLLPVEAPL